MKNPLWNPYLVGVLIGLLSILTFSLANKPLGMSTGLAQASGACAMPILGADKVAANTYWAKTAIPTWDYSTLFLVGTVLGAFLSALLCGVFKFSADSAVWTESFGPSKTKRLIAAFIGGMILSRGDFNNAPLTVTTFLVSLAGAVLLLAVVNLVRRGSIR